ncbi:hypothetical protein ROZALSC1DRAFT_25303 [Rozella allomycis CSF55]|uniref:Uncharacterized protein n=1 Tax=Rozella allomycis (strain CSF55) TaxID=988480 RepID=A0A4P9YB38_ROZAC|nr:hypothetical protein ROZALSC1DRAFT_25303 [Rozella allomycis CSF55]
MVLRLLSLTAMTIALVSSLPDIPNCQSTERVVTYPTKMGCVAKGNDVPSCAIHSEQKLKTCETCEVDAILINGQCFRFREGCRKPKGLFQCDECSDEKAKAEGDICVPKINGCKSYAKDGSCSDCGDNLRSQNKFRCYEKPKDCESDKMKEENDKLVCTQCKSDLVLVNGACFKKIDSCNKYNNDGGCEDCGDKYISKDKKMCHPRPKDCDNDKIKEENGKATCTECRNNLVLELVDTSNTDVRACFDFCKENRMVLPDNNRCEPIGYDLKDECGKSNKWTVWDSDLEKLDCMEPAIVKQHNILLLQVGTLSKFDGKDPNALNCLDLDGGKMVSCFKDINYKHRGSSFLDKYDALHYKLDGTQPHNALVIRRRSDSNFLTFSPSSQKIGWERSENRATPFVFYTELPANLNNSY